MELYDFVCIDCGEDFEVVSTGSIKEEEKVCAACGSAHVRQRFSSFLRSSPASGAGCAAPADSGFG